MISKHRYIMINIIKIILNYINIMMDKLIKDKLQKDIQQNKKIML